MIVGSAFLGPIPFLATAAGAVIGRGIISHMISEADEHLNDDKMSLGKFDVMAPSEVPEVEADLTNLMNVVDGYRGTHPNFSYPCVFLYLPYF